MKNLLKKLSLFTMFLVSVSFLSFGATTDSSIKSITAITEVFGEGQKLTAVAIEYDKVIKKESISLDTFSVSDRTITKAYTNTNVEKSTESRNGKYVILELSNEDAKAQLYLQQGRTFSVLPAKVSLMQKENLKATWGRTIKASDKVLESTKTKNLIVDDFLQFTYKDSKTGKSLGYNLYIPKNYDSKKSYPLVYFGHDAGVTGSEVKTTLIQGIGATIWASPEEQAKHEAFVLAPQYPEQFISDTATTDYLEMTVDLINSIVNQYSIDKNKIYATGQSGGGMLSIAMSISHPDLFAAMYLVACQWDANQMAKTISNKNMWIVVSQGDAKAFPGMNASTESMAKAGAKVARDEWSGLSTATEIKTKAKDMLDTKANIKYVSLTKGTVVSTGQDDNPGSNHVNTWRIAYTFEPVRDWLFTQSK